MIFTELVENGGEFRHDSYYVGGTGVVRCFDYRDISSGLAQWVSASLPNIRNRAKR